MTAWLGPLARITELKDTPGGRYIMRSIFILDEEGIGPALRYFLENSAIESSWSLEDDLAIQPSTQTRLILYRTAQEALSNGGTRYSAVVSTEALDDLGDGRWQVTMRSGKSRLVHMKAGLRDTRALIDARARIVTQAGSSRTEWNLPYAQPNGKLMLRTVVRQEHVECTRVEVTDTGIRLEGVLCGDSLLREGALFVLSRRGLHRAVVHVPVEIFGNRRFRADVPVRHAADQRLTRWEDWDWWLQPDPADRQKFRVCHLLEDFPDVKSVYAYKSLPLMGDTASEYAVIHPARPVWVRPYCSASGAMAMNVVDR